MGPFRRFARAFAMPFRGAKLVYVRERNLVRIWIWPIVLTFMALVGGLVAAWSWNDDIVQWMWPVEASTTKIIGAVRQVAEVVAGLLLSLASVVVAFCLAGVVASPFNEALSEEIDRRLGGVVIPEGSWRRMLRDASRAILYECGKLVLLAAILGPLFLLSLLVPVAGPVVYTGVALLLTAVYCAIEYTEWPWARRGLGLRARLRRAASDLPTTLGFGAGVGLFFLVPFLNLLVMPAAVAGGTLLVREVADESLRASPVSALPVET